MGADRFLCRRWDICVGSEKNNLCDTPKNDDSRSGSKRTGVRDEKDICTQDQQNVVCDIMALLLGARYCSRMMGSNLRGISKTPKT